MNKKIIILISILVFLILGLIIFLIVSNSNLVPISTTHKEPTSSPTTSSPSEPNGSPSEDKDEIKSYVLEKEFENLLIPGTKEYLNFFNSSKKTLDFPIKYPKTLKDWGLEKITTWKGETQGITAIYTKKDKKFTLEEGTISFNIDYMGLPIELELAKNKKGYFWDLLQKGGGHQRILYFDYLKKDDIEYLYTVQCLIWPKKK